MAPILPKVPQILDHLSMIHGMLEYLLQRHSSGKGLRAVACISRIRLELGNPQQRFREVRCLLRPLGAVLDHETVGVVVIPLEGNLYADVQLLEGGSGRNRECPSDLILLPPAIYRLESNFEEIILRLCWKGRTISGLRRRKGI